MLTTKQKNIYELIVGGLNQGKLCLTAAKFEGRDVAVICYQEDAGKEINLLPLALIDNAALFSRVIPATEDHVAGE